MKKLLCAILCLGLLMGCSSSEKSDKLAQAFPKNKEVVECINKIVAQFEENGRELNFIKSDSAEFYSGIYNQDDINIQIFSTFNGEFAGIGLSNENNSAPSFTTTLNSVLSFKQFGLTDEQKISLLNVESSMIDPIVINGFSYRITKDSYMLAMKSNDVNKTNETTQSPNNNEHSSEPKTTIGERNALSTAISYLDSTSFSKKGLIEQLNYEGYTDKEAKYAVDNCGADWNEEASKTAKSYMETNSFSKKGLIEQLRYEGFTQSQAEYGAKSVGY